ncbi:RNA pyrophosphohydrolase [Rubritalea marina]|uniref:RNA pyrophosphohydrolase n=1 Tax=Rubritalea marina TaxID=361055 RepID=UPI00036E4ADA|nr:RNA pyrophosphohydrolase [Rubritalea marina]
MAKYRKNVAAIIMNDNNEMLICERSGNKNAWQFPQGGVDKGETVLDSLYREVEEEVGLSREHYEVLDEKSGYKYLYPAKVSQRKKHDGQQQTYYLCKLKPGAPEVNITQENQEFQDYDWVLPEEFDIMWVPKFKREVYSKVLSDFFGIEFSSVA